MTPTVVAAWLWPRDVAGEFCRDMVNLVAYDTSHNRRLRGFINHRAGANLSTARNLVVERFLESSSTHLWFVDSDMTFAPDTVDRLLEADAPIVSALCFGQRYHQKGGLSFFTVMFRREPDGFVRVEDYPPDEVIAVDAVGAGCILIHRDVFEDPNVRDPGLLPWYAEIADTEIVYGEDVTFCLRARKAGWPVKVHTGVQAGHIKTHEVTEDTYRAWRSTDGQ